MTSKRSRTTKSRSQRNRTSKNGATFPNRKAKVAKKRRVVLPPPAPAPKPVSEAEPVKTPEPDTTGETDKVPTECRIPLFSPPPDIASQPRDTSKPAHAKSAPQTPHVDVQRIIMSAMRRHLLENERTGWQRPSYRYALDGSDNIRGSGDSPVVTEKETEPRVDWSTRAVNNSSPFTVHESIVDALPLMSAEEHQESYVDFEQTTAAHNSLQDIIHPSSMERDTMYIGPRGESLSLYPDPPESSAQTQSFPPAPVLETPFVSPLLPTRASANSDSNRRNSGSPDSNTSDSQYVVVRPDSAFYRNQRGYESDEDDNATISVQSDSDAEPSSGSDFWEEELTPSIHNPSRESKTNDSEDKEGEYAVMDSSSDSEGLYDNGTEGRHNKGKIGSETKSPSSPGENKTGTSSPRANKDNRTTQNESPPLRTSQIKPPSRTSQPEFPPFQLSKTRPPPLHPSQMNPPPQTPQSKLPLQLALFKFPPPRPSHPKRPLPSSSNSTDLRETAQALEQWQSEQELFEESDSESNPTDLPSYSNWRKCEALEIAWS